MFFTKKCIISRKLINPTLAISGHIENRLSAACIDNFCKLAGYIIKRTVWRVCPYPLLYLTRPLIFQVSKGSQNNDVAPFSLLVGKVLLTRKRPVLYVKSFLVLLSKKHCVCCFLSISIWSTLQGRQDLVVLHSKIH